MLRLSKPASHDNACEGVYAPVQLINAHGTSKTNIPLRPKRIAVGHHGETTVTGTHDQDEIPRIPQGKTHGKEKREPHS